jgi:hypothetical protein
VIQVSPSLNPNDTPEHHPCVVYLTQLIERLVLQVICCDCPDVCQDKIFATWMCGDFLGHALPLSPPLHGIRISHPSTARLPGTALAMCRMNSGNVSPESRILPMRIPWVCKFLLELSSKDRGLESRCVLSGCGVGRPFNVQLGTQEGSCGVVSPMLDLVQDGPGCGLFYHAPSAL